jgi:tricorn protease
MARRITAALAALLLGLVSLGAAAAGTKLLRFPNIWHDRIVFSYAGDLWTVAATGGSAVRLTSNPGSEVFGRFSPDGRHIAFTAQYGGDDQVYVMPAAGGAPKQLSFYPASGPRVERWGFDNQVFGWTPDGSSVLFRSTRDGRLLTDARLYTVPMQGGATAALPMPQSGAGSFSPDGKKLVYSPLWRDFRSEKRYQGGWANKLYVIDLATLAQERIPGEAYSDRDPMWIGAAVYFNSERAGKFNLFRYDLNSRQVTQLTHHRDWDVRWPSADADGQIVYELNGELHVYDTRTDADRGLSIQVPADLTITRPRPVNAADYIESAAVNPQGGRVAIVGRGDVFTVPIEHGVTRNLTHSSNAHEREVSWSADGKRVAFVSDRSGEEEVYVQDQDGVSAAVAVTADSTTRYYAPRWSGDGKRIAVADATNRLYVIDLGTRRRIEVCRDPVNAALDHGWSPDGRYLAYSLNDDNAFAGIFVWSAADGRSHRVTPALFDASTPAWSPDGQLLYYLGQREYHPQISRLEFQFATDRQTGIFAVALTRTARNPFGVRNDEPGTDDADEGKTATHDKKTKPGAKTKAAPGIDFDGIEQRAIRVPLEADNLTGLVARDDNLFYLRSGPFYYGRDAAIKPAVMAYSIKEREAKQVAEDVNDFSVTADGKHVFAQLGSKELKYYEVGGKADEAKTVATDGLMTTFIPAEEWREIFAEVWRRYRDHFYVANMHGYDWRALRAQYAPLLEHVANRADLNYLIAEMISELTVQHAYIEGGDLGLPRRPFVALPGARFELDAKANRYRVAAIFAGENEEDTYRSPLSEVGVDVHVGDYVLAINGRPLNGADDPYELLQAAPNAPAEWRVASAADGSGARTIRYQPLSSEMPLRYLQWVTANRARVDARSHGRLGYIHIPDMGENGIREFIKWWYPQMRKEGLVVDERDNGGGNISQMLIQRLAATLHGTGFARNSTQTATYPRAVQPGPKVALINEATASDGDIFAYNFRQWKIGALIGKRTWGGVVGITNHGPLLDGGSVFVPEFGYADEHGDWVIEGHGVDPDIVVEQDPIEVAKGHDPQLERGISELMKMLPSEPHGLPQRAAPPLKAPAG